MESDQETVTTATETVTTATDLSASEKNASTGVWKIMLGSLTKLQNFQRIELQTGSSRVGWL